ncbi:hypothetical protein SASPL_142310 [Salvia splendens]|uniref:Uncharacterized protein n=1 Tax=Salvia splendens TaxID=180675 RepID=A0A8X8WL80_SALSN|nr:hypothetical protein SASPL_142310 [Salvia splendens]
MVMMGLERLMTNLKSKVMKNMKVKKWYDKIEKSESMRVVCESDCRLYMWWKVRDQIYETETESEEIDSPEVERLREDLLDGIDEDSDLCTSIHDLDSFMKSFEEEITTSPTSSHGSGAAEERIVESASDCGESGEVEEGIVELVSDSGESRPDLGYLLEASDDELGIPPPAASPARKELVTG